MKKLTILDSTNLPPYLWIIIAVFVFLFIFGLIVFLVFTRRKRASSPKVDSASCLNALGGEGNILSKELRGSRIIVSCKNYALIDHEALKKAGVTGFIQSSDKLTLVMKDGAEELYHSLFNE